MSTNPGNPLETWLANFSSRRLTGGLDAWVWRRPEFQNRTASLATRFGAMDALFEVSGRAYEVPDGTAHFLEHMAFESAEGSALAAFSRLGVRGNAFTSHSVTNYYFSGTDNFWPALRRLVELVVVSRLTPKGVEAERRVIAQEIRMYEDSSDAKVFENLLRGLYARHPIRRRIAGTVESIGDITPEVLLRCHRTFYHPSNLVFVAAGDLEPKRVFDTLDEVLTSLGVPETAPAFRRVFPEEQDLPADKEVRAAMPVERPTFLLGYKDRPEGPARPEWPGRCEGPARPEWPGRSEGPARPEWPGRSAGPRSARPAAGDGLLRREVALNLLVECLLGPTSPLYNDLYRTGLIDESFNARYSSDRTYGYAVAGGTTTDVARVSERLAEGISGFRQNGIEGHDLDRKRRKARGQFVGLFDSVEELATLFLMYRLKGIDLLSYPDVLDRVTLDEANDALRSLFVPERVVLSAVVPGQDAHAKE